MPLKRIVYPKARPISVMNLALKPALPPQPKNPLSSEPEATQVTPMMVIHSMTNYNRYTPLLISNQTYAWLIEATVAMALTILKCLSQAKNAASVKKNNVCSNGVIAWNPS